MSSRGGSLSFRSPFAILHSQLGFLLSASCSPSLAPLALCISEYGPGETSKGSGPGSSPGFRPGGSGSDDSCCIAQVWTCGDYKGADT